MTDFGKLAVSVIKPALDEDFAPAAVANREFKALCASEGKSEPLVIALERNNGEISRYETVCFSEGSEFFSMNFLYAEGIVKFLLWQKGGWRVYVGGPEAIGNCMKVAYSKNGSRAFDADFMGGVYERDFEVVVCSADEVPAANESVSHVGGNFNGCRIGFDLGASDRKVSAVIDGEAVYTEEVDWDPRGNSDPEYHYSEMRKMLKSAAEHLPRVDAIGGSSAGVFINNRPRVASLFRGIPKDKFESKIADMFLNLQKEWGDVPMTVLNDGEVTALVGADSLGATGVLGVAMGSSEAGGYVTPDGALTNWLNELAFCPVDYNPDAPLDEWSGDRGCGALYFSQQAVFRLADKVKLPIDPAKELAAKLAEIQEFLKAGDDRAVKIWETIGVYLGYTVAHYADFYDLNHVLILGRVTSYEGGNILIRKAREVLEVEFPELAKRITLSLPDEKARRVGQAVMAAGLPEC